MRIRTAELSDEVETLLLEHGGWVSQEHLCSMFRLRPRQFRQVKGRSGVCTDFAIAKRGCFKHVELASTSEWLAFKLRILWHAIREFRRIQKLGRRRHNAQKTFQKKEWEKDTGQGVMPIAKKEDAE